MRWNSPTWPSASAEHDRDYVVTGGRILTVDRRTGHLNASSRPDWVLPLEAKLHVQHGFRVTIARASPSRLLRRFQISRMSGSAAEDFSTICSSIPDSDHDSAPPAAARRPEARLVVALVGRPTAPWWRGVCGCWRQPAGPGRDSDDRIEDIFDLMKASPAPGISLQLLTGKKSRALRLSWSHAGESGSVIIATQVVGRGVDIRLSPRHEQTVAWP